MDVVFLLECGDATDTDDAAWNSTLHFVDDAVSRIGPRSGGTHVALALSSHQTTTLVRKLDHQPLNAAHNLSKTCPGEGHDISESLMTMKRSVFNNRDGDRPEVPDILVLIVRAVGTDGVETAASLKADGIRIVTVAMATSERTLHQLRILASSDVDAQRLVVARAEQYRILLPTLINVVCRTTESGQLLVGILY